MKTLVVVIFAIVAAAIVLFVAMQPNDEQYAYLTGVNELLDRYQIYLEKTGLAIQNRLLPELAEQQAELETILSDWQELQPPPVLRSTHDLMIEALNDEKESLELVIEGIKNRDNAKIKRAIEISDEVAEKIKKVAENLKRLLQ